MNIHSSDPKLIIFEISPGDEVFKISGFVSVNLDLFIYINSKFVYVKRHIRVLRETSYIELYYCSNVNSSIR